jgi:general L-amino acid transport system substrate-binding protein
MKRKYFMGLVTILVLASLLAACGPQPTPCPPCPECPEPEECPPCPECPECPEVPAAPAAAALLDTVKERDMLICGCNNALPGFGFLEPDGSFSGFDVEFCRAIAAAIFDDSTKVEFRPLTAKERFTALQTGEVDVLLRNTTWTTSRDTSVGLDFAPTTFYDGQGIMVRKADNITKLEDLEGATVCVTAGTTTEMNLADQMRKRGVEYNHVVFETYDEVTSAYEEGRCDAMTMDRSGLVSRKTTLSDPAAHVILLEVLSKEPLGPATMHGDNQWNDIVSWVVYGMVNAEELGITSANVDDFLGSEDPVIARLLGDEGDLGVGLGLDNKFVYSVIKHVGNYGEVYDRNLGPDSVFELERGINALWTEGGLIYAPPFR